MAISTLFIIVVTYIVIFNLHGGSRNLGSAVVFSFNPRLGNDTKCLQSASTPCQSLNMAAHLLQSHKINVTLVIEESCDLSDVLKISPGSTSVAIEGVPDHNQVAPNITCHGSNAGIIVNETFNFTVTNLHLIKCNVNSDLEIRGYALGVTNSRNVNLTNFNITNSSSTAIYMKDCIGTILLRCITLMYNDLGVITRPKGIFCAGLRIEHDRTDNSGNIRTLYKVSQSTFSYNRAFIQPDSLKLYRKNIYSVGAMYVLINSTNSSLEIVDSEFSHNYGTYGGGVHIRVSNQVYYHRVLIHNSSFSFNTATHGGGIMITYEQKCSSYVNLSSSTFDSNHAMFGSGVSIMSDCRKSFFNTSCITIWNCTWVKNNGTFSSVLNLSPIDKYSMGHLPAVTIEGSYISNNTIGHHHRRCSHMLNNLYSGKTTDGKKRYSYINSGVLAITRSKLTLSGVNVISNNKYSAIVIVSGSVEFQVGSNTTLCGNIGYNGGALSLFGFSRMILNNYQVIKFLNNTAWNHGGAIFYRTIDQQSILSGDDCFIWRKDMKSDLVETTQVIFENNTAGAEGHSIYSQSFFDCYSQCSKNGDIPNKMHIYYYNITRCLGNFSLPADGLLEIASVGRAFYFPKQKSSYDFQVIPGHEVKVPFSVVDDFNQTITPFYSINKLPGPLHNSVKISSQNTQNRTITLTGKPGESSIFYLSVLGVRQIYFRFNVTLLDCPPGFYLESNSCTCSDEEYRNIFSCSGGKAKSKLGIWMGYIPGQTTNYQDLYFAPTDSSVLNSSLCENSLQTLPSVAQDLSHICAADREGVVCGKCVEGTSSYYHSRNYKCGSNHLCKFGIIFYILSELIPMSIMFAILIIFDLSLTSGNTVGFIFFAQYLDKFTPHNQKFDYFNTPYRIVYGLFNLEFFELPPLSYCIWHGSQILDVIALKHATIGAGLCLVFLLILSLRNNLCGHICRVRKQISAGTSIVHGLCAFLVLCYTQSSKTSFYILKLTTLLGFNNTLPYRTYYGGLHYLGKKHLIYALPSFISLTFVTSLLPVVLIMYPLSLQILSLCKLSEHTCITYTMRLIRMHKLIPLIDCFQSCYKDKCRVFAGLYFLYRIIILYCYSNNPNRFSFYLYSQVFLVIFLGIHCIVQPYKKKVHNIIDALVLFNLSLINALALTSEYFKSEYFVENSSYQNSSLVSNINCITDSLRIILLYAPIVVLLTVVSAKVVIKVKGLWQTYRLNGIQVDVDDVLDYSRSIYEDSTLQLQQNSDYGSTRKYL